MHDKLIMRHFHNLCTVSTYPSRPSWKLWPKTWQEGLGTACIHSIENPKKSKSTGDKAKEFVKECTLAWSNDVNFSQKKRKKARLWKKINLILRSTPESVHPGPWLDSAMNRQAQPKCLDLAGPVRNNYKKLVAGCIVTSKKKLHSVFSYTWQQCWATLGLSVGDVGFTSINY